MIERFWRSRTGRLIAGVLSAAVLGGMVYLLGGLQNGLFWDHLTPESFNEWGVAVLAMIAGSYGFYLGVTDQISSYP